MRRVNGLSRVLRQYLRIESSSTAACSSVSEGCSTLQRQGLYTGSSRAVEGSHHRSSVPGALPRHHGDRAAFGNFTCMSLFSTSTVAGADGDDKDSNASGRPEGTSSDADEPFEFPASSSSVLDDDFALGEFDAEAEAIAQQASGDAEFELTQGILRELGEAEDGDGALDANSPDDDEHQQGIQLADEATKNEVRAYLQQLVDGKLDNQLPPQGRGSATHQQYTEDLDKFMSAFKMQVVHVNRSNKGTRSGGIGRFSTMVVVGNYKGVLGLGVGKAAELGDSVKKAYAQAMKTLFYVPRFRGQTILHPLKAKYGRVLLSAWPKSSHGGIKANNLMASICRLAGIVNIGIKLHGSRCTRNAVKALFTAFESQSTLEETQKQLGNYRIRELAVGTDRKIRKQRKKLASAPGEWYRELPEQPKPHRGPEWPGTEMGPADAARLMLEAESYDRQRAYSSDRRGQGSPRQRPPPSGGRPRPEQRR